jgi:hypothetical protein
LAVEAHSALWMLPTLLILPNIKRGELPNDWPGRVGSGCYILAETTLVVLANGRSCEMNSNYKRAKCDSDDDDDNDETTKSVPLF